MTRKPYYIALLGKAISASKRRINIYMRERRNSTKYENRQETRNSKESELEAKTSEQTSSL